MAKYLFMNNTSKSLVIHGGSNGTDSKYPGGVILPGEMISVESTMTDDDVPLIKVWNGVVLLSFVSNDAYEASK